MTTEWKSLLKKRPSLHIHNVSPEVRKATKEWGENAIIGREYLTWQIREEIIEYLTPKLIEILELTDMQEGMISRTVTTFINNNFRLKSGENSKYDKTIYNALNRHPDWSVTGTSSSNSTYTRY